MPQTPGANDLTRLHGDYVDDLKSRGSIQSPTVEAAFRAVPRHLFLPDVPLQRVYSDDAILTKREEDRVVSSSSQPTMMAIMLEQLDLQPGHRVLEIGAGTGYNAGLMARVVGDSGQVTTLDIDEDLAESARDRLVAAGLDAVTVIAHDGVHGYADYAPYDRIVLTAGSWDIAPAWVEQLKPGGRLLLPLDIRGGVQKSVAFDKIGDHLESASVKDCNFMPLRGDFAKPTNAVPLGPNPGINLYVEDSGWVDGEVVYRLLSQPGEDQPTGLYASPGEIIFGGLAFWLSLREEGFCVLSAAGEMAGNGIVPGVLDFHGEWRSSWTNGLLGAEGLCVFGRPSGQNDPLASADNLTAFELWVRGYGSWAQLAQRLIRQVREWIGAGRPANDRLRLRAIPIDADHLPLPAEIVVRKRWTQLIVGWG